MTAQRYLLRMNCLFLHNTQMADLEREQAAMRARCAQSPGGRERVLPFNILPPFCVCRIPEGAGTLTVGLPENRDGWIVRPLTARNAMQESDTPAADAVRFPLYPPLPAAHGFVLGYAGDAAEECIGETATVFTVKVWYHAPVTVTVEYAEGKSYAAFRETGKESWSKAVR